MIHAGIALRRAEGESMFGSSVHLVSVTDEDRHDTTLLRVSGDIDIATSPSLDARLHAAQSTGDSGILVDLEHVTFMDASGLRSLLRAAEHAHGNGTSFATINASTAVRRLFEITSTAHLVGGMPGVGGVPHTLAG